MATFHELDDACLSCVLSLLSSAKDLAKVQVACKRLRSVGLLNKLWFKWLYSDFGLPVAPVQSARADYAYPAAGAAQQLYSRLCARKTRHALHATAVSTDGSCDEPYEAYWADNMFTNKRGVMYCSSSGTANIHVFARLSSAARPLPAVPQQPAHPPELLTEPQRREFILERCTGVAAHLIQAATFAAWQSELQQQGLLDSRPGGFMVMLLRRMAHQPEDTETAATVRSILNSCSTEGLVEFFLECCAAQAQGKPWAEPLTHRLSDQGLQLVRWMAVNEYQHALQPRSHSKLHQYSLPVSLPTASTIPAAVRAVTAAEPGAPSTLPAPAGGGNVGQPKQHQMPRSRQQPLLCAQEQLQKLANPTCLGQDTCIIHECIFARDGLDGSTCPISSGILYVTHFHPGSQPAAPGSSDRQSYRSSAAAAAGTIDSDDETAAVAMLADLAAQPWVSASNSLTTARAVLIAAAAGQLPPVLDYARSKQGEWIEFEQPSQEQVRQQVQQLLHTSDDTRGDGSVGGSCSSDGGASISTTCVMCPVVWFRFKPRPGNVFGNAMLGQQHHYPEQQYPAAAHHVHHAGDTGQAANAADVAGQARTYAGVAQAQMPAAVAAIAAATAAVRGCTPREQSRTALCAVMPELPCVACEVSAALGYYPTDQMHPSHMTIQLKQPRAGNMVCMKLLNCEDVKPDFNRERGGCNIDMQLVMLRGHALGTLPAGLAVTATG